MEIPRRKHTKKALAHHAGVIANAKIRMLACHPLRLTSHWRHSPDFFQETAKSVKGREWLSELGNGEPKKPCDPEFPTHLVSAG
jgi:hypothetical protein